MWRVLDEIVGLQFALFPFLWKRRPDLGYAEVFSF